MTPSLLRLRLQVIIVERSCHLLKHLHALHAEGEAGAEVATGVLGVEDTNEFVEGVSEKQDGVDDVDELGDGLATGKGTLGAQLLDGLKTQFDGSDLLAVHLLLGAAVLFKLLCVVSEEDAALESCQEIHGHLVLHVHGEETCGLD